MLYVSHTDPIFAHTIVSVVRDGFDEKLNELISVYSNIYSIII